MSYRYLSDLMLETNLNIAKFNVKMELLRLPSSPTERDLEAYVSKVNRRDELKAEFDRRSKQNTIMRKLENLIR